MRCPRPALTKPLHNRAIASQLTAAARPACGLLRTFRLAIWTRAQTVQLIAPRGARVLLGPARVFVLKVTVEQTAVCWILTALVAGQPARLIAIVASLPGTLNHVVNHCVFTPLLLGRQLQLMSLVPQMPTARPTSLQGTLVRVGLAVLTKLRRMKSLQILQRVLERPVTLP